MISPAKETPSLLVGDSLPMRRLRAEISRVANSEIPVLIVGETGSGKELVAQQLHRERAKAGPFVPVNVCEPNEAMFDSAMFGHRKGSFTGAVEHRAGYIAEAEGGTLFLDEICSLRLESQAKLLRAVETRAVRAVGGSRDEARNFRLVSATNTALDAEIAAGRFRRDFYYRIAGIELSVPPLRERREDIWPLFLHFLEVHDPAGSAPREATPELMDGLAWHSWPGNVRELRHAAWRGAVNAAGAELIRTEHLSLALGGAPAIEHQLRSARAECRELLDLLTRHAWDTESAARELGVTRKTIYSRMKRSGISTRRQDSRARS